MSIKSRGSLVGDFCDDTDQCNPGLPHTVCNAMSQRCECDPLYPIVVDSSICVPRTFLSLLINRMDLLMANPRPIWWEAPANLNIHEELSWARPHPFRQKVILFGPVGSLYFLRHVRKMLRISARHRCTWTLFIEKKKRGKEREEMWADFLRALSRGPSWQMVTTVGHHHHKKIDSLSDLSCPVCRDWKRARAPNRKRSEF